MIKNNLINKLNTIYKKVVSRESLYTKKDSSCSFCSLSSMSSFARLVRCRTCRTLFALFVVEHVELAHQRVEQCSPIKSSNMQIIVLYAIDYFVGYILAITSQGRNTISLLQIFSSRKANAYMSCFLIKIVFVLLSKQIVTKHLLILFVNIVAILASFASL